MAAKDVLADIIENEDNTEQDNRAIAQELVDKIDGMIADRDAKCESAKKQLIDSLEITADKYRTATGVIEALRTMRAVYGNNDGPVFLIGDDPIMGEIKGACIIASKMSNEAAEMSEVAGRLGYYEMDKLCKDFYNKDFINEGNNYDPMELAFELMRLDLCRNAGPAAEDLAEFYKHTTEDIDEAKAKLDAIIAEYPELEGITPTPKED